MCGNGGNISVSDKLEKLKGEIGEIGEDWVMEVENSCKAHCLQFAVFSFSSVSDCFQELVI
jgi:hypothetical protein